MLFCGDVFIEFSDKYETDKPRNIAKIKLLALNRLLRDALCFVSAILTNLIMTEIDLKEDTSLSLSC